MKQRTLIPITIVAVALVLVACSAGDEGVAVDGVVPAPSTAPGSFETQLSSGGRVTVEATPLQLDAKSWRFELAFNTHSVDLAFDVTQVAALRCDQGLEFAPIGWDGPGAGGHHRTGVLTFEGLDHATSVVELVVRDVAGVPERLFRWETPEFESKPVVSPTAVFPLSDLGPMAPEFRLPDIDGREWALPDLGDRPVMLFFWATW